MPELAIGFLRHSYIMDELGNYEQSAWACLHAAWICDDAELNSSAGICRKKTIAAIQKAKKHDSSLLSEPRGAFDALMVDLFRRQPNLTEANDFCTKALEGNPDQIIQKILLFQKQLISQRDTGCYTIDGAFQNF